MIDPEAFAAITDSLARRVRQIYHENLAEYARRVADAIFDGDTITAALVTFDYDGVVDPTIEAMQAFGMSAGLFGVESVEGDGVTDDVVWLLPVASQYSAEGLAQFHRSQTLVTIRNIVRESVDIELGTQTFTRTKLRANLVTSMSATTDRAVAFVSDLHNVRMSALGGLSYLNAVDRKRWRRSEILDDVTCPVCKELHGKTFAVAESYQRVVAAVNEPFPEVLQELNPWPPQNADAIKELQKMRNVDIQSRGWELPPAHPRCRGLVTYN